MKTHKSTTKNLLRASHPLHTSVRKDCHETDSPFARHNVALPFLPERFRGDSAHLCLLDHTDSIGNGEIPAEA